MLRINSIYDYTNIHHDNSSHRQHLKVYLQHQSAAFPQLDSHTSGHVTRQQIIKTYRKRVKLESELWHSKCSTPDIHPDKTFFFSLKHEANQLMHKNFLQLKNISTVIQCLSMLTAAQWTDQCFYTSNAGSLLLLQAQSWKSRNPITQTTLSNV